MMEVAVMSHMAGGKKRRGLKLWPGFILGSGLRLSWQSKMWKTARQLNSPRNMPTAWTGGVGQTQRGETVYLLIYFTERKEKKKKNTK